VAALAVVALGWWWHGRAAEHLPPDAASARANPAIPVVAQQARIGDVPVVLNGLGSVTAFNTVTVKSRVDGELVEIAFREGQSVRRGDFLAAIDPRPFRLQLSQAEGQLARDQAQLQDAHLSLERYRKLFADQVVSRQELDDQAARAGGLEGSVQMDRAAIDTAKLQLEYSRITAPIDGRVGLRQVDIGNIVRANDPNGLVVITQLQPIAVIFTLPEDNLPPVMAKLTAQSELRVDAYDRGGQTLLATGSLLTADNRIDQNTGTMRLKAVFQNQDGALFPNQFVNIRLLLDVRRGAVIAPTAAVQRGPQGTFVYVVKADHTVDIRPVTVGLTAGADAAISNGLAAGDSVVVEGVEKLRAGSVVQLRQDGVPATKPAA
jgi:multidrug efflux system membrane fusion protein